MESNTPKKNGLSPEELIESIEGPQTSSLDLIRESKISSTTHKPNEILAQQELDSKFKDGERGESYRTHIHRIVVCGMYMIGFIMIALIAIRAYHFVVPENWKWLDDKQSHDIERIIFSGLILSLAGKYFKKYNIVGDK